MIEIVFNSNLYDYLEHYYSFKDNEILLFQNDLSNGKIYPFTYKQMISNYIEYDFDKTPPLHMKAVYQK